MAKAKKTATKKSSAKRTSKAKAKAPAKTKSKTKAKAPSKARKKAASTAVPKKTAPTTVKKSRKKADKKTADKASAASAPAKAKSSGKVKMLDRQFLTELATAIRDAVLPSIRAAKGREIVGSATSGDATFELDQVAERALLSFLKDAKLPLAYYSEDSGYTTFTNAQPQNLLVVDPIDGSRAAKSGFENCVVAIATTRVIERPTMADVDNALVMEIRGDRVFYAERGKGARIYVDGKYKRPKLSANDNLETISWSMTVPARPAELIFPTAARLIDLTSLKGGFFACNSTSFSLTRLLTNQLDACVDFANRYLRDIPDVVEDQFINAGRGIILGIAPYDFAASILIAKEAGCVVTDAYGKGFDKLLLLDSTVANHQSLIAASNETLHNKLLKFFNTRIRQYEKLLSRHAKERAK